MRPGRLTLSLLGAALLLAGLSLGARHGYFLPSYGALLNLASPPDDLFTPLASSPLKQGRYTYALEIAHKYPGRHVLDVAFQDLDDDVKLEHDLTLRMTATRGGETILEDECGQSYEYWGGGKRGLGFCTWEYPKDIAGKEPVRFELRWSGDLDGFLERYGPAELTLRKGSDL